MRSAGLAPACLLDAQSSAADAVVPWKGCAGSGGLGAAEGGDKGKGLQQQQQQQHQQQQRPAGEEEHLLHPQLPTGPFLRVLELLPPQDQACSGRLACRDAWRHLLGVHHRTAHISQPLPPHAVHWFELYGPAVLKELTFQEKLTRPMSAAAASGSTANLAAVWGLVRQGLHPEMLRTEAYAYGCRLASIEAVLVREGHAQLLPWLVNSGYPVNARHAFMAAAQFCDLAGLQSVWELLQPQLQPVYGLFYNALDRAASCSTGDAIAKMEWLLQHCAAAGAPAVASIPTMAAGVAAARGDLDLLRWMLQRGCDFNAFWCDLDYGGRLLPTPMRHADLEVVSGWCGRRAARCRPLLLPMEKMKMQRRATG